ncbi:MAG: hypothetical protein FWD69_15240 [Polyangiaceae bacterium]|nr:hypothetical protein [Polyangiaceae bacterium]
MPITRLEKLEALGALDLGVGLDVLLIASHRHAQFLLELLDAGNARSLDLLRRPYFISRLLAGLVALAALVG